MIDSTHWIELISKRLRAVERFTMALASTVAWWKLARMSTVKQVDRIEVFWTGDTVVCELIHMMRSILKTAQTPLPTIVKLSLWFKVVSMIRIVNAFM